MRRFINGILAAMLIVSSLTAKTYTDKTFLMPRSHGMNMAMEYTTWHKQTAMIDDDKFGGSIQASLFYDESTNKAELGQYFGVCNWQDGNKVNDFLEVHPGHGTVPNTTHLLANDLFHTRSFLATTDLKLADRLCWRPYRESYGITLDYHQKLDKILKGLFFKVKVPIVHVKTSLGWSSSCSRGCGTSCDTGCDTECDINCNTGCDTKCTGTRGYCVKQKLQVGAALSGTEYSVADYLSGCVNNDDKNSKQVALCKAKIHNGQSETGVADIDVMLGYNFLYKPTRHINATIGLTIPTGNTPDACFLWEPIVGNAGHWALGFGIDSAFELWKDTDKSLDFLLAFNYRYLFSSTEKRTLGFLKPAGSSKGKRDLYGHWALGGKKGDKHATPLANFLTQDIKVTPGSHFEGIAQLAFNYNDWTFDLGYSLFARETDSVSLKCCVTESTDSGGVTPRSCGLGGGCSSDLGCGTDCDDCCWADDTYGVADWSWDTVNAFVVTRDAHHDVPIQTKHLCLDYVRQEGYTTHKLYGGVGYSFNEWDYPLMLGLGGSYEWVNDNNALEVWSLWAKIGLTF